MSSLFKHFLSSSSESKSSKLAARRKSEIVTTASSKMIVAAMQKAAAEENKDLPELSSSPGINKTRRHSVPEPTIHIDEAASLDTIQEVNIL